MSLVGGGSLLIGTIPAIFYMEKFGRRFWVCAMLPAFFVGLLIIGCSYLIPVSNIPAAQGTYIAGLIIYEGFFGPYPCLTWLSVHKTFKTVQNTEVNVLREHLYNAQYFKILLVFAIL
ncbi:hypothetical protein ONS95_002102 [Cadophora gregata]|uniref:uncharacterized protein n=1 Tax=Cadophora gregata TaxID=51156 RepID=UPI0026DC3B31|nr:uncharacterized protein ONS95_002102 [Cadophora gregata]KAK0109404.1 hypothetical protein ONS95_002102 [Cadophora gregata]